MSGTAPSRRLDRRAFGLGEPDVVHADGLVEFDLGAFWLQLAEAPARAGVDGTGINVGLDDVRALQADLPGRGFEISSVAAV